MRPSLAIHGGAGTILKSEMTPDLEKEYRHGLQSALDAGWAVLSKGGPALEAVQSAVVSLEDFPLFNAGRGSVFTHTARNEMDACIMDGARLMSGAVAFVSNIRNPITLARLVMEETEHCLLAGDGAVEFAREHGVGFEPDEYFFTEHRYRQLLTAIEDGRVALDHSDRPADPNYSKNSITPAANSVDYRDSRPPAADSKDSRPPAADSKDSRPPAADSKDSRPPAADFKDSRPPAADSIDSRDSSPGLESESVESLESAEGCLESTQSQIENRKSKMGTVGAVACDANGDLAAATSTGGMTNKKFGRVGDSCIIGAGTYAENATCAVSCTGHGEFFMLGVTAFDVAARMKYKGLDLESAARETIGRLNEIHGEGGFIAVDGSGNIVMPFNSEGMYRGKIDGEGIVIEIFS